MSLPIKASLPGSHPEEGWLCILPADQPVWGGHGNDEEEGGDQSGPAGDLNAGRPGHNLPLWGSGQAAEQTHLLALVFLSVALGEHPCIPCCQSVIGKGHRVFLEVVLLEILAFKVIWEGCQMPEDIILQR